jgi:hypothetical protein
VFISLCHQCTLLTLYWCTYKHNLYICFWFQVDFWRTGINIWLSDVCLVLQLRSRHGAHRVINIAKNYVNSPPLSGWDSQNRGSAAQFCISHKSNYFIILCVEVCLSKCVFVPKRFPCTYYPYILFNSPNLMRNLLTIPLCHHVTQRSTCARV